MKTPRISVLSAMGAVLLVALDGMVFRSIAARESLAHEAWWAALATLPMANLLAVGAAISLARRAEIRPFLIGFQAAGWGAVAATTWWSRPLLDGLGSGLQALGAERLVGESVVVLAIFTFAVVPAVFFAGQAALAALGGLAARAVAARIGLPAIPEPRRARLASLAVLATLAAVPAVTVEARLRSTIDPAIHRLAPGSLAVVDLNLLPEFPVRLPPGSPVAPLVGKTVIVTADTGLTLPEVCTMKDGSLGYRDCRPVAISLDERAAPGGTILVTRNILRPAR